MSNKRQTYLVRHENLTDNLISTFIFIFSFIVCTYVGTLKMSTSFRRRRRLNRRTYLIIIIINRYIRIRNMACINKIIV